MGFEFAGNLGGSAPVVRNFQIDETMYTGYLVMSGIPTSTGGNVGILDVATSTHENGLPVMGICTGVVNTKDAGWNSTNKGDTATFDTTKALQVANDPIGACEVETTLIQPDVTLIRGPIYAATYGTALTECEITTANAAGTTITHASDTVTITTTGNDDLSVAYCRQGASRGHYRVITTAGTNAQSVLIAFPYGTALKDEYVMASCVPGIGAFDFVGTPTFIDGDNTLNCYFDVYYHAINLEESGKEYAIMAFKSLACGGVI